jgi:histone deacetylase 1/2
MYCAEYVDFLNTVTPDNQDEYLTQLRRFNLGPVGEADCPVFDGLFEYCRVSEAGDGGAVEVLRFLGSSALLSF